MNEESASPKGQADVLKRIRAQLTAVQKGERVIVNYSVDVSVVEITQDGDDARQWATTDVETWSFTTEPSTGRVRFNKQ